MVATNVNLSPEESENLRTEYEVCQQVANNATSGYWVFAGIFLAFSSVILAGVITILFQGKYLVLLGFVDTFLSLGMWIIYFAIWQMLTRANNTQRVAFDRMRNIEKVLSNIQIRKNLDCAKISTSGKGASWYKLILTALSIIWLIVLITVWVVTITHYFD